MIFWLSLRDSLSHRMCRHVCYLELQTRFHDWQNGFLNGAYFAHCLDEAESKLAAYTSTLAPAGWQCAYDHDHASYAI